MYLINGKEVTKEEFQIPVEDLVIWSGDGIFDAIGIHQGFLFALEEHIERFKKSAQKMYFDNIDFDEIYKKIKELGGEGVSDDLYNLESIFELIKELEGNTTCDSKKWENLENILFIKNEIIEEIEKIIEKFLSDYKKEEEDEEKGVEILEDIEKFKEFLPDLPKGEMQKNDPNKNVEDIAKEFDFLAGGNSKKNAMVGGNIDINMKNKLNYLINILYSDKCRKIISEKIKKDEKNAMKEFFNKLKKIKKVIQIDNNSFIDLLIHKIKKNGVEKGLNNIFSLIYHMENIKK